MYILCLRGLREQEEEQNLFGLGDIFRSEALDIEMR
jgi:hypothetical protein